jgi:hypothetical protein
MLWLLRRADLIEVINQRQGPHYALVNDPFAKLWLEAQYQRSLQAQAVDSLIDQEQKKLARALQNVAQKIGCLFEYKIRHLLSLFDGRWVEGRLFGVEGEVYLPQLRRVAATTVEWPGLGRHQIDGHASYYVPAELTARLGLRPDQGTGLFVAESKYRLEPVDATEVEDFRQACATVEKCNEEWGFGLTHQWLFARSGLTGPAWEVARRERMLVSDLEQLNELFEMFHLPRAEY